MFKGRWLLSWVFFRKGLAKWGLSRRSWLAGFSSRLANSWLKQPSKPEEFSIQILKHLVCMIILTLMLVRPWIENVVKSDVIQYALSKMGQIWVYHHDWRQEHDVLKLKNKSLILIGVLYGFGSREELRSRRHLYCSRSWRNCSFYRITFSKILKVGTFYLLNIALFNISIGVYYCRLSHTD